MVETLNEKSGLRVWQYIIVIIFLLLAACSVATITRCVLRWRLKERVHKLSDSAEEDRRQAIIMAQITKEKHSKDDLAWKKGQRGSG